MTPWSTRPLMPMDDVGGFLCDWHLAGPFEAGLQFDANPHLWQKKLATAWTKDHLAPWGGAAGVVGAPPAMHGLRWNWDLLPLTWRAKLSLRTGAQEFPAWAPRLDGLDPDAWTQLYYALAVVESPRAMDARLVFSGWDGCRLWINGQHRFDEYSYHHIVIDMEHVDFRLRAGLNAFLFQLDRDGVVARIEIVDEPAAVTELRSVAFAPAPEGQRFGTMVPLRRMAARQQVRMPFNGATASELQAWQKAFYSHYAHCLGDAPLCRLVPGTERLVSRKPRDGYVESVYHLPADGDSLIPAYVLVPDAGRRNGRTLLALHGHEDFRVLLGERPATTNPCAAYAKQLAERGFVVGLVNSRGFALRDDRNIGGSLCDIAANMAAAQGLVYPRLHIADLQIAYDLLTTLEEVDPERLGITGLSGGGSMTYLTAAFDSRFRAAAVFCGLCRYVEYAGGPDGCGMQTVPGVFPTGDTGEILSLIAPRPLLLAQGRLDSTFHTIGLRSMARDARRAYRAAGVEERLEVAVFERPHEFETGMAERFFLKWL